MNENRSASSDKKENLQNNVIVQAWMVLILALVFGGLLACVQLTFGPKIEANKINETMQKVPEVVLGPLKAKKMAEEGSVLVIKAHLIETEKNGKKKFYSVFEARYPDGRLAGWVTKATGQGYADKIELLLGLDPEVKNLTGLFILDQKETPGLGNKIIEKAWRSQFIKKGTDITLKVVKEGVKSLNEINAITGATISSKSVCNIINKSVSDLKGRLPLSGLKNKKEG